MKMKFVITDITDHVLDAVWDGIKDKGWMSEQEFYPYRES